MARNRSRSPLRSPLLSPVPDTRQLGHVRWYNGRRQIGVIRGDNGHEVFIPVGGANNRNLVPMTPGGLMHWTRVSYTSILLEDPDAVPGGVLREACANVVPCRDGLQPGLECGVETRIGGRAVNEDRIAANDLYDLGFLAAIFDGHGGENCVNYVSQRFPVALHAAYANRAQQLVGGVASLTPKEEERLISAAICDAFEMTDEEFMQTARQEHLCDGSTALVVLLAHGFEAPPTESTVANCKGGVAKLFVANCGDSRAILVRRRKAVRLSVDHKPERDDETRRIQKAGGIVIQDQCGIYRVGRKKGEHRMFLSTSRAFGDRELKEPRPLVIAEPEIVVHTLSPDDWAAVICCDGVWNTMSDQDVADAVWQVLAFRRGSCVEAAQEVATRAQATGSTDNVTVFVMRFGWADPPATMM